MYHAIHYHIFWGTCFWVENIAEKNNKHKLLPIFQMVGSATQKQENHTKIDSFFLQKTEISLFLDDTLDSVCVCCGGMKLKKKLKSFLTS